jgi:Holliday junction resolvase
MQRRKGAVREREAVQALVELGVLAWRTAQRMGSAGDAANVVIEGSGIHVEVKGTEKLKWKATAIGRKGESHGFKG